VHRGGQVHRRTQSAPRRAKCASGQLKQAGSSIGGVLEAVYLTLLCLSALMIAWFAVFVVYRLFKGQR
jgi:hypothetical protein